MKEKKTTRATEAVEDLIRAVIDGEEGQLTIARKRLDAALSDLEQIEKHNAEIDRYNADVDKFNAGPGRQRR